MPSRSAKRASTSSACVSCVCVNLRVCYECVSTCVYEHSYTCTCLPACVFCAWTCEWVTSVWARVYISTRTHARVCLPACFARGFASGLRLCEHMWIWALVHMDVPACLRVLCVGLFQSCAFVSKRVPANGMHMCLCMWMSVPDP